jgi:hypothetical protein
MSSKPPREADKHTRCRSKSFPPAPGPASSFEVPTQPKLAVSFFGSNFAAVITVFASPPREDAPKGCHIVAFMHAPKDQVRGRVATLDIPAASVVAFASLPDALEEHVIVIGLLNVTRAACSTTVDDNRASALLLMDSQTCANEGGTACSSMRRCCTCGFNTCSRVQICHVD